MAIPDAVDASSTTGVIGLSHTTSEWVFIGLILALSAAVAVLWIEYKRLKKDKRTLRNLLSQACYIYIYPIPRLGHCCGSLTPILFIAGK